MSAALPAWGSTLTAFAPAVAVGDWQRLIGRTIGAFLGLVPTEYSSGQSRSLGGITKTGNGHARRLLVEAVWHHGRPSRVSTDLYRRRRAARADRALLRRHADQPQVVRRRTKIVTDEGKLFLDSVLDMASRRVVGFARASITTPGWPTRR